MKEIGHPARWLLPKLGVVVKQFHILLFNFRLFFHDPPTAAAAALARRKTLRQDYLFPIHKKRPIFFIRVVLPVTGISIHHEGRSAPELREHHFRLSQCRARFNVLLLLLLHFMLLPFDARGSESKHERIEQEVKHPRQGEVKHQCGTVYCRGLRPFLIDFANFCYFV